MGEVDNFIGNFATHEMCEWPILTTLKF